MTQAFAMSSNNVFSEAFNYESLSITRKDYLMIAKVLDLQAFGNSILELMVGQCNEEIRMNDKEVIQ